MVVKGGTDFCGSGKAPMLPAKKEKGRFRPLPFRNFYSVPCPAG